MQPSPIRVDIETQAKGVIARVTIANDRKLNTLNSALMARFVEAFDRLAGMEDLRAVILTGEGERAFIGGADITEMAALEPLSARRFITRIHQCCEAIRGLPVPVIARIQGFTFGAGLEIAAACDLRLAADTARFGMPEVRLGIPSVVEAALLPMLIGWGRSRRLLLLGETISAADAESWGLVEKIVAPALLDEAVTEWIAMLLAAGPRAIRLQKSLTRQWEDLPLRAAVQAGVDAFAEAWRTDEPKLAMREFLEAQAARKRA
ncbi:MAG TPA: enoyl-CoA hydratase [Rhodopila sp.]|uniref:enoyl-CoA hydratase n=1 Tax=Rhodopila sp. TaxID=2480087 RepID=UPI002BDFD8EF|nr:enoyl-CoA hydratase [Rhodopila sp.]HVY17973.1 enoyl-CoA hydratase [Rhodopila sp.]